MHFPEILRSKSKQNSKNFNEIALILHQSHLRAEV